MRILHILDHSLPMHSGYSFRTRALMKAQQAKGWDVIGVTSARHTAAGPEVEMFEGLSFYRSASVKAAPSPLIEINQIRALSTTVNKLALQFKADVLHAHSPLLTALAGMQVAKRHSLPILYEIRAFWEDAAVGNRTGAEGDLKYRLTKALETYVCRRVGAVAVICNGPRDDLLARGIAADKIMVSPNGVDLNLFGAPLLPDAALVAELELHGADVVGFIGSFYDYEGLDDLISAMPLLLKTNPNAHLILVGGGPMEQNLRAQAAAGSAAARIHFIGRVPHDQVERYYSVIDVLAYPRKKMRLTDLVTPLKPLEAMAQRKLVAASDVGGHRELIMHGKTGSLFSPDNSDACAAALADIFSDRMSWETRRDQAQRYVEEDRNWLSNISRYEPFYQRLIARSG